MNKYSKYKGEVSPFYTKSKGEVFSRYKFDYTANNTPASNFRHR